MFCDVIILLFLATSPVFTAVAIDHPGLCSKGEFQCNDGACISIDHFCDGKADCFDGGDELSCGGISNNGIIGETLHRTRRQSRCSKSQWQCRDGSCVGFDGKCDGTVDCADGSDESFALCRNNKCQSNWHRCTYGACVDGTAPCNGVQECADNSDELLPRCRNETDEVRGQFRCADGSFIPAADRCDGKPTCADGSDESVRACADNKCPGYLFQCAYGACVDGGVDCDNIQDCADGSDESDELCNRISTGTSTRPTSPPSNVCTVPPHPPNGRYTVTGAAGQSARVLSVNVTCSPGFGPAGAPSALCYEGAWSGDLPRCIRYCKLNPHPSVIYRCLLTGTDTEGTRACGALEPSGTEARPECSRPNYYSPGVLPLMRCIDGNWDSVAICQPGLKNGTNITIIIKDQVQVYISNFQYAGDTNVIINTNANGYGNTNANGYANTNGHGDTNVVINANGNANTNAHGNTNTNTHGNTNTNNNEIQTLSTSKPIFLDAKDKGKDTDYDIDYGDWRMGPSKKKTNNKNVNLYLGSQNSTINVHAPDSRIYFKD